jgi:hypothetical protein
MIQRDYIMNLIEQLGVLVRRIINREMDGDERTVEIDKLVGEWIGLPLSTLLALPPAEVLRLFEESDRLVGAKCLIMAEVLKAEGLTAETSEQREALLSKSSFFCTHYPTGTDPVLESQLEGIQAEIEAELGEIPPPSIIRHTVPETPRRVFKQRQRSRAWLRIGGAMALGLIALAVLNPTKPIEVTDLSWESLDSSLAIQGILHNRTAQSRDVTIEFTADRLTSNQLGRSLNSAGKVVQTYTIESDSKIPVQATLRLTGGGNNQVVVSPLILRIEERD